MNKVRVFSTFSGIGAFEKGLKDAGIPFELVHFCEYDKYAPISYCAIHNEDPKKNLGDIRKVHKIKRKPYDLFTYGFPCQDISVAGLQKGIEMGTRSGLLYDALQIIQEDRPPYAIAENVKNLVGKKFKEDFNRFLAELEFYGYKSYWAVLNAKDWLPQNRERVFIVSIRKDIKKDFVFPEGENLGLRLIDMLETEVDEKYYLPKEKTEKLIEQLQNQVRVKEATKKGYAEASIGDSIDICYPTSTSRRGRVQKEASHILQATETQAVVVPEQMCLPVMSPDIVNKAQNGRRFKEDGEPMYTLTGQDRHGVLIDRGMLRKTTDEVASCIDAHYGSGLDNHAQRIGILEVTDARGCSLRTRNYMGQPQQLEVRNDHNSNTVTSVPKDAMVQEEARVICLNTKDEEGKQPPQHDRVYSTDGLMTALCSEQGGRFNILEEPKIIMHNLKQTVSVRAAEVDIEGLQGVLKHHKNLRRFTNKEIAEELDIPVTKVEHWFRTDSGFAIPDAEIWGKLKELLMIETDEFDYSITTFIEKENVFEKADRVYDANGIAPTITSAMAGVEKVLVDDFYANRDVRVYEEYSPTLRADRQGLKVTEPQIQMIGKLDTIEGHDICKRVYSPEGIAPTIPTGQSGNTMPKMLVNYRIRRLTPKECFRLQGFTDEDFEKAKAAGVSDSQLYKQAGNSICVPVIRDILKNLFPELVGRDKGEQNK